MIFILKLIVIALASMKMTDWLTDSEDDVRRIESSEKRGNYYVK